jgi:hypothetical protein
MGTHAAVHRSSDRRADGGPGGDAMSLSKTLQERRRYLTSQRQNALQNINTWERQVAAARQTVADYDAEMAAIDDLLAKPDEPSTVTLTSNSPITIKEEP